MKKSLVTLVLGLVCSGAFSQTNTFPASGNVGIGTLTPTHALTVAGEVKLTGETLGYLIRYASLSETIGGASTILGNNVKAGITDNTIKKSNNNLDAGSYVSLNYQSGITFHTGVTSGFDSENYYLGFEAMRINHNGNVGIGTASPNEKLAVNGKIRAREIKVENTNWPDYVFAPSYKLPTLQETEKHIKEKGHLPGIPSASAVKANGVDLGDMNAKLLQKIEEMTLYLIEMKKENDSFKQDLAKQQQEIKELKSKN